MNPLSDCAAWYDWLHLVTKGRTSLYDLFMSRPASERVLSSSCLSVRLSRACSDYCWLKNTDSNLFCCYDQWKLWDAIRRNAVTWPVIIYNNTDIHLRWMHWLIYLSDVHVVWYVIPVCRVTSRSLCRLMLKWRSITIRILWVKFLSIV